MRGLFFYATGGIAVKGRATDGSSVALFDDLSISI
jgi:hypothetical protein